MLSVTVPRDGTDVNVFQEQRVHCAKKVRPEHIESFGELSQSAQFLSCQTYSRSSVQRT